MLNRRPPECCAVRFATWLRLEDYLGDFGFPVYSHVNDRPSYFCQASTIAASELIHYTDVENVNYDKAEMKQRLDLCTY